LPPPDVLERYEQLLPGAAERILLMAEKATTGEIDTNDRLASAEVSTAKTGQVFAFVLTLFALIAAVALFARHDNVAGLALLSMPVVMLIRSFIRRAGDDGL
jgi:uncharacterized membrane protein